MKIAASEHGSSLVVTITGSISFPEGTALLRDFCRRRIAAGDRRLILDLTAVPWIDSAGLGEVVACYKRAREVGGGITLVLQNRPHRQFTYCHLDRMFEIFPDLPSALAAAREAP